MGYAAHVLWQCFIQEKRWVDKAILGYIFNMAVERDEMITSCKFKGVSS